MIAALSRIKTHFLNWREWELNPIVIKELRQAVRSWAVTGMLLLFLTVLFITSIVFLINQSFDMSKNMHLGEYMFSAFVVILAGASVFFIPLYIGVRVAMERQENNQDLLYVSTLSPFRIVLGKFLCGAYMAVLFFSTCMPFMAFTNLLRGMDLPTMFVVLGFLFLVVCAANMLAIFLACLPVSRAFKTLFVLVGILQSIGVISALIGISFKMMRSGMGTMLTDREFLTGAAVVTGSGLALTGLLFLLTVGLVSPPSSNRALPIRSYLTATWVLGGILCFGWALKTMDGRNMFYWAFVTFGLMMPALLVTISNSDQLSYRVLRTIPQSGLKRLASFLFYNGAAGGLVWVAIILISTFSIAGLATVLFPKPRSTTIDPVVLWFITTTAYAFAYALAALFLHRKWLSRFQPKLTGLLAVLLAGAWAILPAIVLFALNRLSWTTVEGFLVGNVFNVVSAKNDIQRLHNLYWSLGWLAAGAAINVKWFMRQWKNFRPPVPAPPIVQNP